MFTDEPLLQVYPGPARDASLRGLYLNEAFRPAGAPARPFVYASFITSLDGRISLPDPDTDTRKAPDATTNPRDWRLFQELAACADVLVTTGRYIRDLSAGLAQAELPVSNEPGFSDLLEWRVSRGLARQPAVVIVSASLDLPLPDSLLRGARPVYIATGAGAAEEEAMQFQNRGVRVLRAGNGRRVEGYRLISALAREGFANIDMIGGAEMLNSLLADNVLDRLYLTQACRILGGRAFDTLLNGDRLNPSADFTARAIFLDTAGSVEQMFAIYDSKPSA
jgi:riboflavin biosynthesis pyrimidine reductase